jgi:serine protease Do
MRILETIRALAIVGATLVGPAIYAQVRPAASVTINRSGSYLGIGIQEIDGDRAKALKLREEAGVEVTHVEKDSPAEKAGLMAGDAVIQYNGQRVEGLEQFSRMVRETPAGREVKLDIWRNGAPQSVAVKVAARRGGVAPGDGFSFTIPEIPVMPDIPRNLMTWRTALLGVEAESLDGQLAQFFGVKEGVLVRSVVAGSAAEKAGIKAGDVITKVDDANVRTPSDLSSRVRGLRGKSVDVVVMRDRKEITLNVMIADQQGGGGNNRNRIRANRLIDGEELF